jgi:hypothetical protein
MIAQVMKISPLLWAIDEYQFYTYHRANYDRGFIFIANLCWNWTQSKWIPPFLAELDMFKSNNYSKKFLERL